MTFSSFSPKFGIGRGKAEFAEFVSGLIGSLKSIAHDIEAMKFFEGSNFVVVEGTTEGIYGDATTWSGGRTPGGRFCSMFEFRDDGLISRMPYLSRPGLQQQGCRPFPLGQRPSVVGVSRA